MTQTSLEDISEEALEDTKKAKPITRGFYKGVSWAVFPNTIVREDGTEVTIYNTIIEGRYTDKDGNHQGTSYFSEHQLAIVEDAAREARKHIRTQRMASDQG